MIKSKIQTILGVLLLIFAIGEVLFAINKIQTLKSGAEGSFAPQDLKITNIKDTSFTVSWLTDTPTIGFVEYSKDQGQTWQTPPTNNGLTHFINVQNLTPNSSYSFRINSGGQFFDNAGLPWSTQTLTPQLPETQTIISGKVLNTNRFPAKNALIYVNISGSLIFSSLVSASGNWIMSIPTIPDSTILQITVESSPSLVASAKIDLKSANPTPPITIGQSYDFTSEVTQSASDTPKVPITLP